jgi:hypothetical protein
MPSLWQDAADAELVIASCVWLAIVMLLASKTPDSDKITPAPAPDVSPSAKLTN